MVVRGENGASPSPGLRTRPSPDTSANALKPKPLTNAPAMVVNSAIEVPLAARGACISKEAIEMASSASPIPVMVPIRPTKRGRMATPVHTAAGTRTRRARVMRRSSAAMGRSMATRRTAYIYGPPSRNMLTGSIMGAPFVGAGDNPDP